MNKYTEEFLKVVNEKNCYDYCSYSKDYHKDLVDYAKTHSIEETAKELRHELNDRICEIYEDLGECVDANIAYMLYLIRDEIDFELIANELKKEAEAE